MRLLIIFLSLCFGVANASDGGFLDFIDDFYLQAKARGITESTYKRAFKGIDTPDSEVIRKAGHQPEFRQELWQYLDSRIDEYAITEGRRHSIKWRKTLDSLERDYGVRREVLLAIWSMESSYGGALKHSTSSIIRSLATLAYLDKKRSKFARTQLLAALEILQSDVAGVSDLMGSWAGAMGHTQFIPTSYLAYSQDGDGDGDKDVWHSVPDALASAANLLKQNGWRAGQTWGYEVVVPESLYKREGETLTIQQWESSGIVRVKSRVFPDKSRNAILFFPSGTSGPAFLMLRNFYVIKSYNNADKYALAVGHLSDRLSGGGEFIRAIPRPFEKLNLLQRLELQRRLRRHGFYDGKIDGKIGPQTRDAITKAQKKLGLSPTGHASKNILKRLKSKSL